MHSAEIAIRWKGTNGKEYDVPVRAYQFGQFCVHKNANADADKPYQVSSTQGYLVGWVDSVIDGAHVARALDACGDWPQGANVLPAETWRHVFEEYRVFCLYRGRLVRIGAPINEWYGKHPTPAPARRQRDDLAPPRRAAGHIRPTEEP